MESNYLNLTLTEFLDRCVNNDFGDIEIYDYIRQKTYNFEKEYTCLMYHSVADYAQNYLEKIYPNVKNKGHF